MKPVLILTSFLLMNVCTMLCAQTDPAKFVIESDNQVKKTETGPHDGGGQSIGYSFFNAVKDYPMAFRKRVLQAGSSIGYHLQTEDEVYYILEGNGEMKINGKVFRVKPGDAILTRTGSSHGLAPDKGNYLSLIILYEKK